MDVRMRKSSTITHVRLTKGQRVSLTKVCDISFTIDEHDCVRTFHALCDFRAADVVLDLPWLDDEQATLKFGTERLLP
jgi:hypothetical protein